jgi:hypothetical protein
MDLEPYIRHVHGSEAVAYKTDELVVVCLVRDGRPYLKSFIEHYFSLGVKHIVFMDNGSSDGTVSAARSYDNVTILQTELPFKEHKKSLRQYMVTRFGRGRWILHVDIDELFDYPYSNVVGLRSFLRYLNERSYTAVVAHMLDMLPEKAVSAEAVRKDEPLKELYRFYDISNIKRKDYGYYPNFNNDPNTFWRFNNTLASDQIEVYRGGIHGTIFGTNLLALTKHPLMFVDEEIRPFVSNEHWVGDARVADITCVLFHYKFISDFYERVVRAVEEENYHSNSAKYKKFMRTLEQNPDLQVKLETARELETVNDLVDNGFLVVSGNYMAWVDAEDRKSEASNLLRNDPPRRLMEAFDKANARARIQARASRDLERQVEQLQKRLAKNRIAKKQKDSSRHKRQTRPTFGSISRKLLVTLGRIRARLLDQR